MDSLEKFIIDNRDGMDSAVPDLKVWAEIDKQMSSGDARPLHVAKVRPLRQRLRAAATIAILLIAGGIGGSFLANKSADTDINSLADISPEHAETELFFNQQVEEKMAKLVSYEQADVVRPDLQQLDEMFKELTQELENAPKGTEEEIINAMIKNYQAKVDILNRVLEKVEAVNAPQKTTEDEISI